MCSLSYPLSPHSSYTPGAIHFRWVGRARGVSYLTLPSARHLLPAMQWPFGGFFFSHPPLPRKYFCVLHYGSGRGQGTHPYALLATARRRFLEVFFCPVLSPCFFFTRLVQSTFARWGALPYLSGASTRLHNLAASLGFGLHHQRRHPLKQGMLLLIVSSSRIRRAKNMCTHIACTRRTW